MHSIVNHYDLTCTDGGHGQDIVHVCTPVKDIHEVQVGLEGVTTWEVLGQALRVEQTVLDHIQMNSQSESDKTNKVLRYILYSVKVSRY